MQNSMWKFATLLGVIGIGCLVVVQVQKNLKDKAPLTTTDTDVVPAGDAVPQQMTGGDAFAALDTPSSTSTDFNQFEPAPGQGEPEPVFQDRSVTPIGFEDATPAQPSQPDADAFDMSAFDDAMTSTTETPSPETAVVSAPQQNAFDDDAFAGFETSDTADTEAPGTLSAAASSAEPMGDPFGDDTNPEPVNDPSTPAFGDSTSDGGLFGDTAAYQPETRQPAGPPQTLPETTDVFGDDPAMESDPLGPAFGEDPAPGRTSLDAAPSLPQFDNARPEDDAFPFEDRTQPIEAEPVTNPLSGTDESWTNEAPSAPIDPVDYQAGPSLLDQEPIDPEPAPLTATPEPEPIRPPVGRRPTKSVDSVPHGTLRPQLKIQKSAPASASIGKPLIYSIRIKNVGNAVANEVIVEDEIPRGARLTGTIPRAELVEGILVWRFPSLPPNEEKEIKIRVVPEEEGSIGSVATVNFRAEIGARTTVTAPRLRLELQTQPEARIGDTVEFRYRVINEGTGDATNVWLKNPLPPQLQHPEGRELEFEVGDLPAGKSRDVTLQLVAASHGEARNSAVVTADGIAGDRAEAAVQILGAQLQVTRRGPSRRYLNRQAVYENTVTNTTHRAADNARLVEYVPDGMEFVGTRDGGQFNPVKRTITWPINRIGPGESVTFAATLRPTRAGRHDSVVEIIETAGFKSRANSRTEVVHLDNMGLQLSELDGPVAVGEEVMFTINVRNRGTSTATNSVLQLKVPRELRALTTGPTAAKYIGDLLTFPAVPQIAPNATVRFQVKFKASTTANNVRLRASIRSDQMPKPLPVEESITIYDDAIGTRQ